MKMTEYVLWKNDFPEKSGCRRIWFAVLMIGLMLFVCSCSSVSRQISEKTNPDDTTAGSLKKTNVAYLKIVSRGLEQQDNAKPYLFIRYIQYSIDGKLLAAHNVMKDFERTVDLAPGRHFLHVERLRRGILSARALILDEGDCYEFTLLHEQSGVFEGMALPGLQWETSGFSGVESWEKMAGNALCEE